MKEVIDMLTDIRPDVDFENCKGLIENKVLDSIDIITIVAEISEQFEVAVPPEELTPENFDSAESIFNMINRLKD